jgi:HTH-type transcriptional regulator/antitoxin HigA
MPQKSRHRAASLAEYIKNTSVTQTELARLLGVSPSTVNCYVSGRRTPSLGVAVKLSRITGVPVERLLGQGSNSTADARVA